MLVAILVLTHHGERAFSPALVYLGMGLAAAAVVDLLDAPWLVLAEDAQVVERLSEIAVVVALFATGLRLDRALGLRTWRSTLLLLGVVMPVTIAAVALLGVVGMGLSAGAAVVLGAALAPTDPVLAGDLGVGPPGELDETERSFALTSEAGLNDGLAFPFVLLGLVIAGGWTWSALGEWLAADVAWAIAGGVLIGAVLGRTVAAAAVRLRNRELLAHHLDGWAALGAVLAIYGIAELAGTYGFLAAFAGGIAFRRLEHDHEYNEGVHAGAEASERALELAMILFVGSLVTLEGLRVAGPWAWAVAALLLVVVRPLASALALRPSPLSRPERLWVGWFGVRGVGSIYYATAALGSGLLAAGEGERVLWTVVIVVLASIVAHGISGSPLTRRIAEPSGPTARVSPVRAPPVG